MKEIAAEYDDDMPCQRRLPCVCHCRMCCGRPPRRIGSRRLGGSFGVYNELWSENGCDVGGCRLRFAPDRVCSRHRALRHQRRCRLSSSRPRRCSARARRRRRSPSSTGSFAANNATDNAADDGQHGQHDHHVAPLRAPERVELGDDLQSSRRHDVRVAPSKARQLGVLIISL